MKHARPLIIAIMALYGIITILSCANRGTGPQGGPKDTTPPQVVKYSPADGSVRMQMNKIEITFDEIVVLQNASQKIIVSPPQRVPADIKAVGHKIQIAFIDSLIDSTTYTIDFADAIADNNEGNKLEGFTYAFSTGDYLDSMSMSGIVLDAASLNPVPDLYVGLHTCLDDTAFTTTPFRRITKSNAKGEFEIHNAPQGSYHIFGLDDAGGNYIKDMPGEMIAFADTVYTPTRVTTVTFDTIYNKEDSTAIDTVIMHKTCELAPTDIVLLAFTETDTRQYLTKAERKERHQFTLMFNTSVDSMPRVKPLNFTDSIFRPQIMVNPTRDTITYWLPDTTLWKQDTLRLELSYTKIENDSAHLTTDTLNLAYRAPKTGAGKTNRNKSAGMKVSGNDKPKNPKLVSSNATSIFDVYRPLEVRFTMPTRLRAGAGYRLEQKQDTIWHEIRGVKLEPKDSVGTLYVVNYAWKPETTYRLTLDSALFLNMINQTNDEEKLELTTKSLEQYSKLILHLANNRGDEVVQLLDSKDKPVRTVALYDTTGRQHDITMEYVTPGTYFLRLFHDENHDGAWTPGLYSEHRQAEEVVYFPYDIELRAFWDVEEDWNITSTPLLQQKPKELKTTGGKTGNSGSSSSGGLSGFSQ